MTENDPLQEFDLQIVHNYHLGWNDMAVFCAQFQMWIMFVSQKVTAGNLGMKKLYNIAQN